MNTRILYISKGEGASPTRYRALQFFPLWRKHGYWPLHVTASGGLLPTWNMLRAAGRADIVIVLRKTFPSILLWLLRRIAKRLIFEFDDSIFCNTDGSPSRTRMARFVAMVRACDHVIAGNDFLRRQVEPHNHAVSVIPTCLDVARYHGGDAKPSGVFDLVWIGSHATKKYLAELMPALAKAAGRIPHLRLKIIADFDLPNQGILTLPSPWSAATEVHELECAHVGIAPMREDDWSRGKCALKVLQYMAAGLPVISSKAGANAEIVGDGIHGFLATTEAEWCDCIARLAGDDELCRHMGAKGRQLAQAEYDLLPVFERLRGLIENLRDSLPASRQ